MCIRDRNFGNRNFQNEELLKRENSVSGRVENSFGAPLNLAGSQTGSVGADGLSSFTPTIRREEHYNGAMKVSYPTPGIDMHGGGGGGSVETEPTISREEYYQMMKTRGLNPSVTMTGGTRCTYLTY